MFVRKRKLKKRSYTPIDYSKVDYRNPIDGGVKITESEDGVVGEIEIKEVFVEGAEVRFEMKAYFKLWGDAVLDLSVDKVSPVYCVCGWKYDKEGYDFTGIIENRRKLLALEADCDIKFIERITEEEYFYEMGECKSK